MPKSYSRQASFCLSKMLHILNLNQILTKLVCVFIEYPIILVNLYLLLEKIEVLLPQ